MIARLHQATGPFNTSIYVIALVMAVSLILPLIARRPRQKKEQTNPDGILFTHRKVVPYLRQIGVTDQQTPRLLGEYGHTRLEQRRKRSGRAACMKALFAAGSPQ
jgi:membrane protein YdbS with pleckstrin-like domain